MAEYAPIFAILFELCVWLWLPARSVARFAVLPTFRMRRFRYITPEGAEPPAPPLEHREKHFDPALSTALRVARALDTTLRVESGAQVKLVRLRARFVGDVLEVRASHYPELVLVTLLLGLVGVAKHPLDGAAFLLLAPLLVASLSWPHSREEAHDLVLELLELAKPSPTAQAFELVGDGYIPVLPPRDLRTAAIDTCLDAFLGRPGGALLALVSLVGAALSSVGLLVGVLTFPIARNPVDAMVAVLTILAFGVAALMALRWVFLGVRRLVRGRSRKPPDARRVS